MRTYGAIDLLTVPSTPAPPAADAMRFYAKSSDGKFYTLNSAGQETVMGSGAGGGSGGSVPVGAISMWPTATAPAGSLLCNGSEQLVVSYPELDALLGPVFGRTNGSGGVGTTHFRLPDFRGRSPIGVGSVVPAQNGYVYALGQKFGEEMHILNTVEIPAHTHMVGPSTGYTGSFNNNPTNQWEIPLGHSYAGIGPYVTSTDGGSGGAHNTVHPTLGINYIIKAVETGALAGTWQAYTPTMSAIGGAANTATGRYTRLGNTVHFTVKVTLGTGFTLGAGSGVTLPVPRSTSATDSLGKVLFTRVGVNSYDGYIQIAGTTSPFALAYAASSNGSYQALSATAPLIWQVGDTIEFSGTYEAA